jgi:outer membrane protein OmpA-like peptidoglycan-associated protein
VRDKCPDEPEDKDGFEDEDGCPDPDNDKDGILGRRRQVSQRTRGFRWIRGRRRLSGSGQRQGRRSRRQPTGVRTSPVRPRTTAARPKFEFINVTQEKIELKQAIFFQTAKAVIMSKSFGLLDEVAVVLLARPTMQVRIEGHTDGRGGHAYNLPPVAISRRFREGLPGWQRNR